MPNFKRVSLVGSEELFRPTRPQVVADTDDVIKETVDRPGRAKEVVLKTMNFTPDSPASNDRDRSGFSPVLGRLNRLGGIPLNVSSRRGSLKLVA